MENWLKGVLGWLRSPSATETNIATAAAVVDRLIDMGYLKYIPESEHERLREQLIDKVGRGYLDTDWDDECNSADQRGYCADNEDLDEGDIGKSILTMREVLERERVVLEAVEDDFGRHGYDVIINGQRHPIYGSEVNTKNIWAIAIKRHLEIVDGLLERAGSEERLHAIYGGNDGRTILLTTEMHEYLRSLEDVFDEGWMPRSAEGVVVEDS